MSLILMGLPGADKGTQIEEVIDTYGVPYISTGDMFRAVMKDKIALGPEAKFHIDKGELVPNEVIDRVVRERLAELGAGKGSLLDGFPRTLDQAKALGTVFKELSKKIDAIIDIHIKEDVLIERLAGRLIRRTCGVVYHKLFNSPGVEGIRNRCGGHEFYQREDDEPETVKDRLAVSIESSAPTLAFYNEQGLIRTIDGNREIDTVFSDARKIIDEN